MSTQRFNSNIFEIFFIRRLTMFDRLFDDDNISTEELIGIANNDFIGIEEEKVKCFLRGIVFHPNCDDSVLRAVIQNYTAPIDKLDTSLLRGIAHLEVKTIETVLVAIKRLKGNENFMAGIKLNEELYKNFIQMQNKAIDEFNNDLNLNIDALETADTLEDIENIKVKKTQLEQKRQELLEQYPEELVPEKKVLEIALFTEAVERAETKVNQFNNANKDFKEKMALFDDLYTNTNDSNTEGYMTAWREFKKAGWKLSCLSFNQEEKKQSKQRATNTF